MITLTVIPLSDIQCMQGKHVSASTNLDANRHRKIVVLIARGLEQAEPKLDLFLELGAAELVAIGGPVDADGLGRGQVEGKVLVLESGEKIERSLDKSVVLGKCIFKNV